MICIEKNGDCRRLVVEVDDIFCVLKINFTKWVSLNQLRFNHPRDLPRGQHTTFLTLLVVQQVRMCVCVFVFTKFVKNFFVTKISRQQLQRKPAFKCQWFLLESRTNSWFTVTETPSRRDNFNTWLWCAAKLILFSFFQTENKTKTKTKTKQTYSFWVQGSMSLFWFTNTRATCTSNAGRTAR